MLFLTNSFSSATARGRQSDEANEPASSATDRGDTPRSPKDEVVYWLRQLVDMDQWNVTHSVAETEATKIEMLESVAGEAVRALSGAHGVI